MARKKKRSSGLKHGFKSKAQWRYFYARGKKDPRFRKWAHEIAHRTQRYHGGKKVGYHSLPARRRGPRARTLR